MELQLAMQQGKQMQQQAQIIEEQLQQLAKAKEITEKIGMDKELILPITPGVFVKAKLVDPSIFVNVGAGITVKKTKEETTKLITEQLNELKKYQQELLAQIQDINLKAKKIEKEVQKLMK